MDPVTRDVLLAQDGDDGAFRRFIETTERDVRRFCSWFTNPGVEIDDLVQETFLRAFRGLHTFSGRSSARSWLLTIARRACLDAADRRRREDAVVTTLTSARPTGSDIEAEVTGTLLVDDLSDDFRHAFVLVRILGFGYDEAATILGCPRGTVQSRVARARIALAELHADSVHSAAG